jgi:hypothetical protein
LAKDIFHDYVKEALIVDGWTITHEPLTLLSKAEGGIATDLGAEKVIVAEKGLTRIAVEVKSFINLSPIADFRDAVGQYGLYISALTMKNSDRILYLAIPDEVFYRLIKKEVIRRTIEFFKIKILLYNVSTKTITSWIES